MVEDDELVGGSSGSINLDQNVSKSKKAINLTKLRKSKNDLKCSKSKKRILDKFKILINLTMPIHTDATGYLNTKTKVFLTYLR